MKKLSLRNKRILILVVSLLLLVLCILFVYRPMTEKMAEVDEEIATLEEKYQRLRDIQEKENFYRTETASMQQEIATYARQFPADVLPEDGILLGDSLESGAGMSINNISLGEREFLYSVAGISQETPEEQEGTLSEQTNEETKKAIDEIEGHVEEEEASSYQPATDEMALYRVANTMSYVCTYQNLKDMLRYLADQPSRMTIDTLNASFDSGNGNLSGSLTINQFFMTGTGASYQEPSMDGIGLGQTNIFGTVDAAAPKGE